MKTKSLILLSIAVIALCNVATAQNAPKTDGAYINGLKVGDKYTKAQLISVFGKPKEIRPSIEDPNFYIFDYGTDFIYWMNDAGRGQFYGCEVETDKYSFCGIVKVGDSISVIEKLHGIATKEVINDGEIYAGVIHWKPSYPDKYKWEWLQVGFYYDNKGKIVRISVFIPFI